jgi:hypothetical protein
LRRSFPTLIGAFEHGSVPFECDYRGRTQNGTGPERGAFQDAAFGGVMGVGSCCLPPWWGARLRLLATAEGLDDAHCATAIGAWFSECERTNLCCRQVIRFGYFCPKQRPGLGNIGLAGRTGQQTVVTDAMETIREDVDQEPADKLVGRQPHDGSAIPTFDPVIFPLERNGVGVGADQTAV